MTLLRRKRLRKLRYWLHGKPRLVIPSVVIGGYPTSAVESKPQASEDEFLWGREMTTAGPYKDIGLRLPAPSDAEWAEQYNTVKGGHVTYDAGTAQTRLANLITNGYGKSIPAESTIDKTMIDRVRRHQTAIKGK